MLATHVRGLAESSISNYVNLIKGFAKSDSLGNSPYIVIEVRVQKKSRKGAKGDDEELLVGDKDQICFKPSIDECSAMILSSIDNIADCINQVNALESDLVPFLSQKPRPCYPIGAEATVVVEAKTELTATLQVGASATSGVLEAYAKYDYLLGISRKALVAEYFAEN